MERIQRSNKCLLIVLLTLAFLLSVFAYVISINQTPVKADIRTKAYRYEISNADDYGFQLIGYYNQNNESYYLSELSESLQEMFALIEQDRVDGEQIKDVEVKFNQIEVYMDSLVLSQGKYTFSGNLTIMTLDGNACISVLGGAHLVTNNFVLSTMTPSPLLFVNGAQSSLTISSTTFTSEYDCLIIQNGASFNVLSSSQISSTSGVALSVVNASAQINSGEITTSSSNNSAIVAVGAESSIIMSSTTVNTANFDYAMDIDGARVTMYSATKMLSKKKAIRTNTYIVASYNNQSLNPCTLNIYYTGTFSAHDILIVKDFSDISGIVCNLLNKGYSIRYNAGSLYISKQYKIYYYSNCSDSVVMPSDDTKYYDLAEVNIQYVDVNIRKHYRFLGYAFTSSAVIPDLTDQATVQIDGADIKLYAVWEAVDYSITMQGVNPGECENPTSYNYSQRVVINNPTRQYYNFAYWIVNGTEQVKDLTLPFGGYTDIEIEAQFELSEFDIVYNNLTDEQIAELNLQTTYTIESPSLNLSSQSYILKGYSFYGLYDTNGTDALNAIVNFGVGEPNTINFVVGQTLTLSVDIVLYHNGVGVGTKNNPYIIENAEQFYSLISGIKEVNNNVVYIKITEDLVLDQELNIDNRELNGFVIDGGKKVITINSLHCFDNKWYSLFPNLNNCIIKNLTLEGSANVDIVANSNIVVSLIANNINSTYLSSVVNNVDIQVNYALQDDYASVKISGFVNDVRNSIMNNCAFNGKLLTYALMPNKSVYLCGFAANASNSLILNGVNSGTISYTQEDASVNAVVYIAGFAVLNSSNQIVNCFNNGTQQLTQGVNNQTICTGVAVIVRSNNTILNCVSVGKFIINNQTAQTSARNKIASLVWSILVGNQIEDCVAMEGYDAVYEQYSPSSRCEIVILDAEQIDNQDYNDVCNQSLSRANDSISLFVKRISLPDQVTGIVANYWGEKPAPDVPTIQFVVKIHNNINNEIKVYVFDIDNPRKIVINDMFTGYLFEDFYFDKEYSIKANNLSNINDNMELYAKYITYQEYTLKNSVLPIILVVVDLLLLIIFMAYCEKPRRVIFVKDGKDYDGEFVKWGKTIELKKDKKNYVWYQDAEANKQITSLKMPFVFGAYRLYAFSDKQGDAIEAMHKHQEELKNKTQQVKKDKEQINKQKEKDKKQKEQIKKQKANAKKSKVQQEIENSGITIVKKEVKISKK